VRTDEFLRGDANGDGSVNLSDTIFLLNSLFLGWNLPSCEDAADTDDSGLLELTDCISAIGFFFLGGMEPPPPGPYRCGLDPTADLLDCNSYPHCR